MRRPSFAWALGAVVVATIVAFALLVRRRGDEAPRAPMIRVVDVPAKIDAERALFTTRYGRVVERGSQPLHLRREAHETWLPLGRAEATFSTGGALRPVTLAPDHLVYVPPYAASSWTSDAPFIAFVTAPEDDPQPLTDDDPRLRDASDVTIDPPATRWMLDKLTRVEVTTVRTLGPFADDAAIYVVRGRGELRGVGAIVERQLVRVPFGRAPEVIASSPLTLLVFDPARTTVSPILQRGQKRYSQDDEELIIRDFFSDRRGGRFLDVGAGHYRRYSTTFYLEEQLGWSGVAIDALAEYGDDYRRYRPRTTFVNALVTDRARGVQSFYRADGFPEVSSVSRQLAEAQAREFTDGGAISERRVPTTTLDAVLDKLGIRDLDLVSMDIEEHEPQALAGFDLPRFHPALVCVEAHPAVRDALWSYFRRHRYLREDRYLAWDQSNWYFVRGP
jgi:FkbM family methyltransferase